MSLRVFNSERRFGENKTYLYCQIDGADALLTDAEYRTAIERAAKNKEDLPSFWQRLAARVFGIRLW